MLNKRGLINWGLWGCIGQIIGFAIIIIIILRIYNQVIVPLSSPDQTSSSPKITANSTSNASSSSIASSSNVESSSKSSSSSKQVESSSSKSIVKSSSESSEETSTVFQPEDVSDATIESISTYGDYLIMYQMIINDYFAQYEAAIKGTLLYSESSFSLLKSSMNQQFAIQKQQYGSMTKLKIVGKSDLVKFLKDLRDELAEQVAAYKDALQ